MKGLSSNIESDSKLTVLVLKYSSDSKLTDLALWQNSPSDQSKETQYGKTGVVHYSGH